MSLKITGKQLLESQTAFISFAAEKVVGNQKLAYNLGKTSKQFREEVDALQKQIAEVYKSFGAVDVGGGKLQLAIENLVPATRADFDAQLKQINEIEIELWGSRVTFEEIEKAKIDLAPIQYDLLSWLIADPSGENTQETAKAATA